MTNSGWPANSQDKRLLSILDSLFLGAVIIDPHRHRVVYVNREAAVIMNREPADMIGRVCHEYICLAAVGKCPITDLKQHVDQSERCVLDRSGKRVPILKSVKKIQLDGREHLLETFMDISDVKEKERLKGALEMAGAASHHLGQPLQALLIYAEELRQTLSNSSSCHFMEKMMGSIEKLKEVIKKIQRITCYETKEYATGINIVDIDRFS